VLGAGGLTTVVPEKGMKASRGENVGWGGGEKIGKLSGDIVDVGKSGLM